VGQWSARTTPRSRRARAIQDDRYGNGHLTSAPIKKAIDGALGSRGAVAARALRDKPSRAASRPTKVAEIDETAQLAIKNGYQLCVHRDRRPRERETLNIFERALGPNAKSKDLRWRVEHAQHSARRHSAVREMGVIASMQGIHCTSDAPYVLERLGPARAQGGAYVWQKLMRPAPSSPTAPTRRSKSRSDPGTTTPASAGN